MIIQICTDAIFASVIVLMFFTNARVILHTSGQVRYNSKQLKTLAISNNTLAFLEIMLMMFMHQSNQSNMIMIILNVLLAITLVLINLFLTFVIEPAEIENHFIEDHITYRKKRPLISKTVNELLLMTNKNHEA